MPTIKAHSASSESGSHARTKTRAIAPQRKTSKLAPDGLPWPPGYFDKTPRIKFEDALAKHGVRPNHYHKGWPIYTEAETSRPEFRSEIMNESREEQEAWKAEWNAREAAAGTKLRRAAS